MKCWVTDHRGLRREKIRRWQTQLLWSGMLAAGTIPCTNVHAAAVAEDPEGRSLILAAQRAVSGYHEGDSRSVSMLRVVYFHPSDREPLPDHAERLDRVMNDISDFYRDGLRRFGIENNGIPLERKDGRLVLHSVRGKYPASAYHHESGDETAAEVREALGGKIDFEREHVLILYALTRTEPDGRVVFDAPYYGASWSDQRHGLCHAADCEYLDPLLLKETKKKIVYTEHYFPRMEQTVARFNSWYIGGIAHEIGHALGLNHDAGNPAEQRFGTSLMGNGNHTYRQEVWGGGKPTFLSRVSALQLISHPLFSGANRGRWEAQQPGFEELTFAVDRDTLQIQGRTTGTIAPYAAVAYVWPYREEQSHGARTFPVVINDGAFTLRLNGLTRDSYHLLLSSLHVNGGTSIWVFRLDFDAWGKPDVVALNSTWLLERAKRAVQEQSPRARDYVSDEVIARVPAGDMQRQLKTLQAILDPSPPLDLKTVKTNRVFVSDAAWLEAKVGWGSVRRNQFWSDDPRLLFLTLGGRFFEKGLYAHSPSRYAFEVGGKWKTFTATVGIRDGAHEQGSAIFTIRGDGRELYRSPMLRVGTRHQVKADVTGVKQLELLAEGGEGHPHNSWAIWAEPELRR